MDIIEQIDAPLSDEDSHPPDAARWSPDGGGWGDPDTDWNAEPIELPDTTGATRAVLRHTRDGDAAVEGVSDKRWIRLGIG